MTKLNIPKTWESVTPAWMTKAIARRCPGAIVKDAKLVKNDDGTNRRARFALTYAAGSGPETVFLKAHTAKHRFVHLRNGNLFNEARFFKTDARLPVDHPLVYASVVDYLGLDFLLVMEDLLARGADPRDATRPMNPEQVTNGVQGLSRFHGQYWDFSDRKFPNLAWTQTWRSSKGWLVGLARRIPVGLERGKNSLPKEIIDLGAERILNLWSGYADSLRRFPMTLLHGDAHVGNTYVLPNGEVGFLDWQVLRRGEWSQDVGYFLAGALTPEDRRAHEKMILAAYRDALTIPEAQKPSPDHIWLRYRASMIYGLAIWLSTLGTDGYQAHAISLALAERYAAAFLELDSLQALNAPLPASPGRTL